MKNILVICKHNRFRSILAEAYLRKYTKKFNIKSAGLIRGTPISKFVKKYAKDKKLKIKNKPQGLTSDLVIWQDAIVIVADDVPKSIFKLNKKYGKKVFNFNIKDAKENDFEEIEKIGEKIEKKVKKLIKELR